MPREKHLTIYRRHTPDCPHVADGVRWLKCECPCWVVGPLPDGRIIRRTLGTRDWSRALRIVDLLDRGEMTVAPVERRSVADGIKAYVEDCQRRGLQQSTTEAYGPTLAQLAAALGSKAIEDVTAEAVAAWHGALRREGGKLLKPRTQVKQLIIVRSLFNFFRDRGWIPKNPASAVKLPKTPVGGATEPLTPVEVRKVLAGLEDRAHHGDLAVLRLRALVPLLLNSGLRISDVAALRRDRINWKTRHLVLRQQQKTGTPVTILLPEPVILALDKLPESMFANLGEPRRTTIRRLQSLLNRLGDRVGVHCNPHRFRDCFSVTLLAQGVDIRIVQKLLGHTSVQTTEAYYAAFMPAQQLLLDAAVQKLDYSTEQPIAMPVAR